MIAGSGFLIVDNDDLELPEYCEATVPIEIDQFDGVGI